MSRETVKNLVENIYNSKYDTLKENLAKVVSGKAMNILESKKADVAKSFFVSKKTK
jgi:hypothetical protein